MFEAIRLLAAGLLIAAGVIAGAISILGVFRFRFVMNRMHCAAILDTISMAGILGGLMLAKASMAFTPKLLAALGAMMGWRWLAACFLYGVVTGAAAGILLLLFKGQLLQRLARLWSYFKSLLLTQRYSPYQPEKEHEGELPFAPFLAIGGILACLFPL